MMSRSDEFSQSETKRARGTSVLQWANEFLQENPDLQGPDDPLQLWRPQMQGMQPPIQGMQPPMQGLQPQLLQSPLQGMQPPLHMMQPPPQLLQPPPQVLQPPLQNYDEKWAEEYLGGDVPVLSDEAVGESSTVHSNTIDFGRCFFSSILLPECSSQHSPLLLPWVSLFLMGSDKLRRTDPRSFTCQDQSVPCECNTYFTSRFWLLWDSINFGHIEILAKLVLLKSHMFHTNALCKALILKIFDLLASLQSFPSHHGEKFF